MKHPEQQPDEIYMGNSAPETLAKSSWRTSRLGLNPLKADGSPLIGWDDLKPWFIKKSEVQAAIEAKRLENKPWSQESITVYEKMLAEADQDSVE